MRRPRGASLGTVLAIVSVAMLAAFTMAATSSVNLQIAQRVENSQISSQLAESALQEALAQLTVRPSWTGEVDLPGPVPDSGGRLTFNRTSGLPFSTNNQDASQPNGWPRSRLLSGSAVPTERAHLVAVGRCRNVERTVEALVYVPNFTVSISSNGRVLLRNSMVASLKSPEDLARLATNPELLGPGDLATNDASANAITLDAGSYVTGNVQSCGTVSLRNGSRVDGEVRAPYAAAALPTFQLTDYDPARVDPDTGEAPLNYQEFASGTVGDQNLVGLVRCDGGANVQGDLVLDNSLFYVQGNLNVSGGVRGAGAVIVTGNTTIRGGANLTSDDAIALLSEGNIELLGDQPDKYEFHGLIYTRGNFTARNFTVLGAFIANGRTPGTGNVTMEGSNTYFTAVNTKVPVFYPRQLVLQIAGTNYPDGTPGRTNEGAPPPGTRIDLPDGNQIKVGRFPGSTSPDPRYPAIADWDNPAEAAEHENGQDTYGGDDGPWHWFDTVLLEVRKENDQFVYYLSYKPNPLPGAAQYPERFTSISEVVSRLTDISATMCPDYNDHNAPEPEPGFPYTREQLSEMETPEHHAQFFQDAITSWVEQDPAQPAIPNFSFDPNRFLKQKDKVRVAARIEY